MSQRQRGEIKRDWLSKILAGFLLGFIFAILCSGVYLKLTPDVASNAKVQLAMWLVIPIWMLITGVCFFYRKGIHAWLGMLALNLALYAVFHMLPAIHV